MNETTPIERLRNHLTYECQPNISARTAKLLENYLETLTPDGVKTVVDYYPPTSSFGPNIQVWVFCQYTANPEGKQKAAMNYTYDTRSLVGWMKFPAEAMRRELMYRHENALIKMMRIQEALFNDPKDRPTNAKDGQPAPGTPARS